jgi:peptidyl-prolyl cis-trans isomerase A (cyclophilin A)
MGLSTTLGDFPASRKGAKLGLKPTRQRKVHDFCLLALAPFFGIGPAFNQVGAANGADPIRRLSTMNRLMLTTVLLLGFGLVANLPAQDTQPTTKPTSAPAATEQDAPAGDTYAVFVTDMGDFIAKLATEKAPKTAANFAGLAAGKKEYKDPKTGEWVKGHYYDGLKFHRVAYNFVIQGGCPLGNGTGNPGFSIDLEIHPELRHTKGALSMARSRDPNSAGSQFFVCTADVHQLDNNYAVFGHVVEGMDVVSEIGSVPINPRMGATDGTPKQDVHMKMVRIVKGSLDDAKAELAKLHSAAE